MDLAFQETEYFKKRVQNINRIHKWKLSLHYLWKTYQALEDVKDELESGIILKASILRQKELYEHVNKECFQQKQYNYLQAKKCESFFFSNDYKLNLISSLFKDMAMKKIIEFESCYESKEFYSAETLEEKDRLFQACYDKWVVGLKTGFKKEVEEKANSFIA